MNCWWLNWLIAIAQGLIGSLVAALAIFLTRKWWYSKFQSELAYVYSTRKRFDKALKKDIKDASSVKIMSMRGEALYAEIKELFKDNAKIAIMMSSISNDESITVRAKALGETPNEYKRSLARAIGNYAELLSTKEYDLDLKFHNLEIPFRLIFINEKYVYVSTYPKKGKVDKSTHYKYVEDKGNAYFAFYKYFEESFSNADSYEIERKSVKSFQDNDGNHALCKGVTK